MSVDAVQRPGIAVPSFKPLFNERHDLDPLQLLVAEGEIGGGGVRLFGA